MKYLIPIIVVGILLISGFVTATIPKEMPKIDNDPPGIPEITGPTNIKIHAPYNYSFIAIDWDGDNISYQIDWKDGEISNWTEWYPSNREIVITHTYHEKSFYQIMARAKDIHGSIGEWGKIQLGVSKEAYQSYSMPSSQNVISDIPSNENNKDEHLIIDDRVYVEPGKKLTLEHLSYLQLALSYIQNSEIKQVVQEVINEILDDGDATSDEIQDIIESSNAGIGRVYILTDIKTTELTSGGASCFPGLLRSFGGFNAKGIFVNYNPRAFKDCYGWHLHINGELVSEEDGYILGYFGYIQNILVGECEGFVLDGIALLVFHGKSDSGSNAQQSSTENNVKLWDVLSDIEQQFFNTETEEERLILLSHG